MDLYRTKAAASLLPSSRELIGRLCRAGWETIEELTSEATAGDTHPGMVAAVHTASSDLRWHPHVHALALHGGWDNSGTWRPLPHVDVRAAELLFRKKVIAFLAREDLLDENRLELLDSWKSGHTGFSAHTAVTVRADDGVVVERLACYLLRPPVSLERLRLEPGVVLYRHKRAARRGGATEGLPVPAASAPEVDSLEPSAAAEGPTRSEGRRLYRQHGPGHPIMHSPAGPERAEQGLLHRGRIVRGH